MSGVKQIGTKAATWRDDESSRRGLRDLSDRGFYNNFSELAPFDNGEGFWTAELNRNVEMQEFVKHGRQILKEKSDSNPNETNAFRAAADKLLKILEGRGDSFARYYLSEVLEKSVTVRLLEMGAQQFYTPHFPGPFVRSYDWENSRGFVSGVTNLVNCNPYNWVFLDEKGKLTISRGDSDWFTFNDDKSNREKEGGAGCFVATRTCDILPISDNPILAQKMISLVYVRPEHKKYDRNYFFKPGRELWSWAARDLFISLSGIQNPEPDFLWRAMILNEYLAIRGDCSGRFCAPPGVSAPDLFFHVMPRFPLPLAPPNRY